MSLTLKTAPASEPVTVALFAQHARISTPTAASAEETDLLAKLKSARRHIEQAYGRAIITQTWYLYLEAWPNRSYIDIPLGNLQSVTAITYTDSTGGVNTFPTDDYKLTRTYTVPESGTNDADAGFGRIALKYGKSWPSATLDTGEPIRIEFVCGWKDAASVPADVALAVEMLAAHWYRKRETVSEGNAGLVSIEIQRGCDSLMGPYQDYRF